MGGSPPTPPSPEEQAQAQAEANRLNQFTPLGNLTFSGPNRSTATIELSPEQQQLLEQRQQAQQLLQQGAIGAAPSVFGDEVRQEAADAAFERRASLLRPEFARQEESLRQRLANQGLPQASRAFESELNRFDVGRNQTFEQAAQAAVLAGNQARAQELNNVLSVLGLQQQQPSFFGPGAIDVTGPIGMQQQAAQQAAQAQRAQTSGMLGLGGAALGGLLAVPTGGLSVAGGAALGSSLGAGAGAAFG